MSSGDGRGASNSIGEGGGRSAGDGRGLALHPEISGGDWISDLGRESRDAEVHAIVAVVSRAIVVFERIGNWLKVIGSVEQEEHVVVRDVARGRLRTLIVCERAVAGKDAVVALRNIVHPPMQTVRSVGQ